MVRPLLLAEPGPGDASCTTWTLTVFFHLFHLQAGRPSGKFAFCRSSTLRSSPSVSNQSIFFTRFRSYDLLRSIPITWSSSAGSGLATFSDCFQPVDLLRPFPVFRPSPFFLRSQPCDWLVSVYGGVKLLSKDQIVKAIKAIFRMLFSS